MENILTQENLSWFFQTVIFPLLSVVIVYVIAFIKNKSAELKNKTLNDKFDKYLELGENAIITAVTSVSQTYVSALKNNGTFTKEAQITAFNQARSIALSLMNSTTKEVIAMLVGDFNTWINNTIESVVKESK